MTSSDQVSGAGVQRVTSDLTGTGLVGGFSYLASPYSHPDPLVREQRYLATASALRTLLANRIWAYSPIVHCHELSKIWGLPGDAEFWKDYNAVMIHAAKELLVLRLPGWDKSVGVKGEVKLAIELKKPIAYLSPGDPLNEDCSVRIDYSSGKPPAARF